MEMKCVVLALMLLASFALATERKSYDGYKLYNVSVACQGQLDVLSQIRNNEDLDFWDEHLIIGQSARIMVAPQQQDAFEENLKQANIEFSIPIENIESLVRKDYAKLAAGARIDNTRFWSWDEISDYLDELAENYPNIATVETVGHTSEGREIRAIKISKNSGVISGDNPIVLVESTIHASEWIAPALAIKLIHELVENSADNDDILEGLDWIIVPVLNIDGYIYSQEVDRFWRKTRSIIPGSDCRGVDANRNFPYMWDYDVVTKDPCSIYYSGPSAASEPETRAMMQLMQQFNSTRLYLTLHSFGQLFLYPWTYTPSRIDNYVRHEEVAQQAADAIYAVNGTVYRIGTSYEFLTLSSGISKDFAAYAGINLSFTVELPSGGTTGFDIEAERIPMVTEETFAGLVKFGQFVVSEDWE